MPRFPLPLLAACLLLAPLAATAQVPKESDPGIELTRLCQKELAAAEQKVRVLTGSGADETLEPLDPPEDDG